MNTLTPILKLPLLGLALWALAAHAWAQTDDARPDEEQPVHITADTMDIQDLKGISIYTGDVKITQGSLTLTGDKITLHHPQREIQSILAEGQPAHFKRFDPKEQAWIEGEAETIDYRAQSRTVLLTGSAMVEQPGKHRITGPKLFYDLQSKTLQAEGVPEEKKRISVTLMPEASQSDNKQPSTGN